MGWLSWVRLVKKSQNNGAAGGRQGNIIVADGLNMGKRHELTGGGLV